MFKFICTLCVFFFISFSIFGQDQKPYKTTSSEFIFAFSDVDQNGINQETAMRFSCFFHYGSQWHKDFNTIFGMYTGTNLRNIGFKTKNNDSTHVYRAYSLGMPLALKFGAFDNNLYMYAGGEYELFFHYKHKLKTSNGKTKHTDWFSPRLNTLMPSVFVGIQFPKGLNLRFSYYLDHFLNKNYTGTVFNNAVDYGMWDTQVYYISLSFNIKKDVYKEIINKSEGEFVNL